jgi:hypothetical protein
MVVLLGSNVKSKFILFLRFLFFDYYLSRDITLEKIKQNTLLCIKRQTPFNELVHDQKNYYLESVTSNAQIIPLYDEQVKLHELK